MRLSRAKFDCIMNPWGISYNPVSIACNLDDIANERVLNSEKLIVRDGAYYHYNYHSSIVAPTADGLQNQIVEAQRQCRSYLKHSATCFISLGSSIVHRLQSCGDVVSNCHKLPQSLFVKAFLTQQELIGALELLISSIKIINPDIQIIFTVSPVRHTRHGLVANQRSKAALLCSIHAVIDTVEDCQYFPSYEILQDDLRDYRFYTQDMIHPSQTAIDYVWTYLIDHSCSAATKQLLKRINQINSRFHHRPLYNDPATRQPFLERLLADMLSVEAEVPSIQFSHEKQSVKDELGSITQQLT